MNDLYTKEPFREQGIATTLIKHCQLYTKSKGAMRLQWLTAKDNQIAQAVYKNLDVK